MATAAVVAVESISCLRSPWLLGNRNGPCALATVANDLTPRARRGLSLVRLLTMSKTKQRDQAQRSNAKSVPSSNITTASKK
jgi:hypothetical protein